MKPCENYPSKNWWIHKWLVDPIDQIIINEKVLFYPENFYLTITMDKKHDISQLRNNTVCPIWDFSWAKEHVDLNNFDHGFRYDDPGLLTT